MTPRDGVVEIILLAIILVHSCPDILAMLILLLLYCSGRVLVQPH
jgi:hypothetical protein